MLYKTLTMKSLLKLFVCLLALSFLKACTTQNGLPNDVKRQWMLVSFQDFSKDFLMKNKAELNLTNNKNNSYSAFMGCNQIGLSIDSKNKNGLKFYNLISTEMYCEDNQNLESEFVKWLPKMNRYKIEGHFLTLSDDNGNQMKFVVADWD